MQKIDKEFGVPSTPAHKPPVVLKKPNLYAHVSRLTPALPTQAFSQEQLPGPGDASKRSEVSGRLQLTHEPSYERRIPQKASVPSDAPSESVAPPFEWTP